MYNFGVTTTFLSSAAKTEGFSQPSNNRTPSRGVRFVGIAHFQEFPDFPRRDPRPGHMLPGQLDIAFSHLDIRVAKDFCELVKIASVHHVPGRERMAIMPLAA